MEERERECIETSANICYEGVLAASSQSQGSIQTQCPVDDNQSIHSYDDIIIMDKSQEIDLDYENVDPATGFPMKPRHISPSSPHIISWDSRRLCIPIITSHSRSLETKGKTAERAQTLRPCWLELKQKTPNENSMRVRGTVSVIIEAADYEVPL